MNNNEYVVYPSKGKIIGLAFLSAIFILAGILFIIVAPNADEDGLLLTIVGIISIVFFGLCLVYLLSRLVKRKPSIIISEKGIYDQSSYISAGNIKWDEIKDFYIYEYMGQKMLGIELNDPDLIIDRTTGLKRILLKSNKKLVDAQVSIPQNTLSIPLEKILLKMNEYYQAEADRY